MNQDCEPPFTQLKVDGGMTVNEALLRLQADLLGIAVGERERERGKERLGEREGGGMSGGKEEVGSGDKGIHEGRIERKRRNGQSTINVRTLVARGTYIHM